MMFTSCCCWYLQFDIAPCVAHLTANLQALEPKTVRGAGEDQFCRCPCRALGHGCRFSFDKVSRTPAFFEAKSRLSTDMQVLILTKGALLQNSQAPQSCRFEQPDEVSSEPLTPEKRQYSSVGFLNMTKLLYAVCPKFLVKTNYGLCITCDFWLTRDAPSLIAQHATLVNFQPWAEFERRR